MNVKSIFYVLAIITIGLAPAQVLASEVLKTVSKNLTQEAALQSCKKVNPNAFGITVTRSGDGSWLCKAEWVDRM